MEKDTRQIIMDHFINPIHKGFSNNDLATKVHLKSDSCADELDLEYVIIDQKIINLKFDGSACAIATSSADILLELLLNKTYNQANSIIDQYYKLLNEEPFDQFLLGDLTIFINVPKQKNRIKCAKLMSDGIKEIIK